MTERKRDRQTFSCGKQVKNPFSASDSVCVTKWFCQKMIVSHCRKFNDVYLSTRWEMPPLACMHALHFMQKFAKMTPNDFHKNKEVQIFCIIAYHRSIETWKNKWLLERSWNWLQNLSDWDFLARFVKKLCRNEHSWSELGGVTGSQKLADSGLSSKMEKNNLRSKKSTPKAYLSTYINVSEI